MHFGIFYARLAHLSNYELLLFFAYVMLAGALQHKHHGFNSTHMPTCLSTVSKCRYQNFNQYRNLHLFPSQIFICCHCHHGFEMQQKIVRNRKLGIKIITNFPFFPLVHSPPVLKHLNVSYTKSSSKWIWREIMVKPTLIKVSISEDFAAY